MSGALCVWGLTFATCADCSTGERDASMSPVPISVIERALVVAPQDRSFRIATNTLAFERYGFNLMLREAEEVRRIWHLKVAPLTPTNVHFQLTATAGGVRGGIWEGPYTWIFSDNSFYRFVNTNLSTQSFRYKDDASAALATIKSKITTTQAETIARRYVELLGVPKKELNLIEPPSVNQYRFEEGDGTMHPLPVFSVVWDARYPGNEITGSAVKFVISGITEEVVEYFNVVALHTPKQPVPGNYLDMLEILPPTNRLQSNGLQMWPHRQNGGQ